MVVCYLLVKMHRTKFPDPNMLNRANTPPLKCKLVKLVKVLMLWELTPFGRNPVNVIRIKFDQIDTSTVGLNLGRGNDDSKVLLVSHQADEKIQPYKKNRAQRFIAKIDTAINTIAGFRADLGAIQNRLNSTIANLAIQSENFSAANSRIRDTDFAEETTRYTQSNILSGCCCSYTSQPVTTVRFYVC